MTQKVDHKYENLLRDFTSCTFVHYDEQLERHVEIPRFVGPEYIADALQGYICKAFDEKDHCYRCIKAAKKEYVEKQLCLDGGNIPENFGYERDLLRKLASMEDCPPSVCQYICEWTAFEYMYFALQYCSGGNLIFFYFFFVKKKKKLKIVFFSLKDASQRKYMSEHRQEFCPEDQIYPRLETIQYIFQQIVYTLHWLHNKGICHLDLSLENILICNKDVRHPRIVLIDFGVAVDFGLKKTKNASMWLHNENVGKPGYKSFEVKMSDPHRKRRRESQGISEFYDARKADVMA
ncbi:death-associated protein kinase 1 [Reticulomyxa filosa]|uniref:Death-associated protein kinase 1 n=1 Tax=Reticulomyxa filosa TaxID=46433 RepID=X6M007_RETFI|nr:death-associated protein kinase 1 [Reticulomyxa filosa]|eukprot:ETO06906.1 death-associated protein kinase 1 [Reticulomyxa filosa]